MADYLTYPVHDYAHLGWDPCPGSPEGCRTLAAALDNASADAGELAALIDGLRLDTGGWSGESAESFEESIRTLPRHLELTGAGFTGAAEVLRSWADALETFQQRAIAVDVELGHARRVLASARGVTLPSGYDTTLVEEAARDVYRVESMVDELNADYLAAARAHGDRLNSLGNDAWGATGWQRLVATVDDIGDSLEDSAIGQAARTHSGTLASIEHHAGAAADGLFAAAFIAALVPPAQPAAPALASAGRVADGVSTAAAVGLALGGHGRWVDVATSLLPGSGALRRLGRHVAGDVPAPDGERSSVRRHRDNALRGGEKASQEQLWQQLRDSGGTTQWDLHDAAVAQRWADTEPWDLPNGAAYLEAEPRPANR